MAKRSVAVVVCPNERHHTKAPTGYTEWHWWAERMARRGYVQERRCPGCWLWKIWKRKKPEHADDA